MKIRMNIGAAGLSSLPPCRGRVRVGGAMNDACYLSTIIPPIPTFPPTRGKGREALANKDVHAIALQQAPSGTGNDTANHRNRSERLAIRAGRSGLDRGAGSGQGTVLPAPCVPIAGQ